jgi:hypothetical protein
MIGSLRGVLAAGIALGAFQLRLYLGRRRVAKETSAEKDNQMVFLEVKKQHVDADERSAASKLAQNLAESSPLNGPFINHTVVPEKTFQVDLVPLPPVHTKSAQGLAAASVLQVEKGPKAGAPFSLGYLSELAQKFDAKPTVSGQRHKASARSKSLQNLAETPAEWNHHYTHGVSYGGGRLKHCSHYNSADESEFRDFMMAMEEAEIKDLFKKVIKTLYDEFPDSRTRGLYRPPGTNKVCSPAYKADQVIRLQEAWKRTEAKHKELSRSFGVKAMNKAPLTDVVAVDFVAKFWGPLQHWLGAIVPMDKKTYKGLLFKG